MPRFVAYVGGNRDNDTLQEQAVWAHEYIEREGRRREVGGMSIRRVFSDNLELARLQRKADQESELGCMALQDGDKEDANKHFTKMKEYQKQYKELRG